MSWKMGDVNWVRMMDKDRGQIYVPSIKLSGGSNINILWTVDGDRFNCLPNLSEFR